MALAVLMKARTAPINRPVETGNRENGPTVVMRQFEQPRVQIHLPCTARIPEVEPIGGLKGGFEFPSFRMSVHESVVRLVVVTA